MIYFIVVYALWGIIWGVATNKVIENKGYEENWFWWGFVFGFIALIVATTKEPVVTYIQPKENNDEDKANLIKKYKELLDMGAISEEEFAKKKSELL